MTPLGKPVEPDVNNIFANAYNGVQGTGENGIAGAKVQLTNCASSIIAETTTNAAERIIEDKTVLLENTGNRFSGKFCQAVRKGMAVVGKDRYQSIKEFLQSIVTGKQIGRAHV